MQKGWPLCPWIGLSRAWGTQLNHLGQLRGQLWSFSFSPCIEQMSSLSYKLWHEKKSDSLALKDTAALWEYGWLRTHTVFLISQGSWVQTAETDSSWFNHAFVVWFCLCQIYSQISKREPVFYIRHWTWVSGIQKTVFSMGNSFHINKMFDLLCFYPTVDKGERSVYFCWLVRNLLFGDSLTREDYNHKFIVFLDSDFKLLTKAILIPVSF